MRTPYHLPSNKHQCCNPSTITQPTPEAFIGSVLKDSVLQSRPGMCKSDGACDETSLTPIGVQDCKGKLEVVSWMHASQAVDVA